MATGDINITPSFPPPLPPPLNEITVVKETLTKTPEINDVADIIVYIPTYSRWFSWNDIHERETRFLPEFFNSKSHSKTPKVYKYYRNSIIKTFRQNPSRKITFTEARKTIIGDVGSVRKVFDFLETWGLINYSPVVGKHSIKWDEKETKSITASLAQGNSEAVGGSGGDYVGPKKRLCSGCKTVCNIACFISEKFNLTLCARCYVRGNNRAGVNSSDFKRVVIDNVVKKDWTYKETLKLLETTMHFGNNWKKISKEVGRSESECITHFIKLPFGEQFVGRDFAEVNKKYESKDQNDPEMELRSFDTTLANKKARLNPLADASNPIMAQAAFLSALGGVKLSEAAAQAAVNSLCDSSRRSMEASIGSLSGYGRHQGVDATSNGDTNIKTMEKMLVDAQSELDKEEMDLERAMSYITDVQLKEIQDKILKYKESESMMERDWDQLLQLKHQLFVDQLTLNFQKNVTPKSEVTMQPIEDTG